MKQFDNQHMTLKGTDDINAHLENMGTAGYQLVSGSWSDASETFDLFFTKELEVPSEKPLVADPSKRLGQ